MTTARLYCSGLNFTYNPHRLLLNKVTDVYLGQGRSARGAAGRQTVPRCGRALARQMLNAVTDMSYGILSIVPKYADCVTPIEDFEG